MNSGMNSGTTGNNFYFFRCSNKRMKGGRSAVCDGLLTGIANPLNNGNEYITYCPKCKTWRRMTHKDGLFRSRKIEMTMVTVHTLPYAED